MSEIIEKYKLTCSNGRVQELEITHRSCMCGMTSCVKDSVLIYEDDELEGGAELYHNMTDILTGLLSGDFTVQKVKETIGVDR